MLEMESRCWHIGSYHSFPVGVAPNVFKVLEPRLENLLINRLTKRFEQIASFHPVGVRIFFHFILRQERREVPSFAARPSECIQPLFNEASEGSVLPLPLRGREFGQISHNITRPRIEHEVYSWVISPCPLDVLGKVNNAPNKDPQE